MIHSVIFILGTLSLGGWGAPLKVFRDNAHLTVSLSRPALPREELDREFTSGLTSHVLIRLGLKAEHDRTKNLAVAELPMTVKYDLWDNAFGLTFSLGTAKPQLVHFSSLQPLFTYLESLRIPVAPLAGLNPTQSFVVQGWLLIEPVSKERALSLQKWIAENAVNQPGPGTTAAPGGTSGVRFNKLFNRLLEQHFSDPQGAKQQVELITPAFRPVDLK